MRTDQDSAAGQVPPGAGLAARTTVLGPAPGDSLLPALHRAAYRALRLDRGCDAVRCDAAGLPALFDACAHEHSGLCLGAPLGRAVLPLADEVSELAMDVGSADTVVFRGGRSLADQAAVHGITAVIRQVSPEPPRSAVVLGSGVTARAALAALRELGVLEPVVGLRDHRRAGALREAADRLGVSVELRRLEEMERLLRGVSVVVSTLPEEAANRLAPVVALSGAAVLDAACSAWPTRLAKAARFTGSPWADGTTLLVHRTARQLELLLGPVEVPVAALRAAARAELRRRAACD